MELVCLSNARNCCSWNGGKGGREVKGVGLVSGEGPHRVWGRLGVVLLVMRLLSLVTVAVVIRVYEKQLPRCLPCLPPPEPKSLTRVVSFWV